MEIIIDREISLNDIDKYYIWLDRAREIDAPVDIKIPISFEKNNIGLIPAVYQFVITWSNYSFSGKLLLDIQDPAKVNYKEIFENEHLFPITTLAWIKNGVYNTNGSIDMRPLITDAVANVRDVMVKAKSFKGWKLQLVSIDHFPSYRSYIPAYETPSGFIDNENNTHKNLKPALKEIFSYSREIADSFSWYEKPFIGIIHELLKNTYEWGRTNKNNVAIDLGVRGLFIKFYKKRRISFLEDYKWHKGLFDFFSSDVHKENDVGELYFFEISVFDSGIGFVDKFESIDKSKLSDIDIIKRCMIKHMTSAKGLSKDDKGIGLDRILSILSRKGFLRIKTNKSVVYRNLISNPYKNISKVEDLELFDWKTNNNSHYTNFSKSSGSVITIIYPLSINFFV